MAGHGLCFMCYRREEREQDERWDKPDRHARQLRKAQRTTLMQIWNALGEIVDANLVPESTCEQIREILRPEIAKIAGSLKAPVNSEHNTISEPFTEPEAVASPVPSPPRVKRRKYI